VRRAFSIIEIFVSIAIVAILLSLLLPALGRARDAGYKTVCAQNLRQMAFAWHGYMTENKEMFPQYGAQPEWYYGGAVFRASVAELAQDRPINRYLARGESTEQPELAGLFQCPADAGIFGRTGQVRSPGPSILDRGSCFREYGNSYRANGMLFNSSLSGIDRLSRPLFMHEVTVNPSRLLLSGDSFWFFAIGGGGPTLNASWHRVSDAGNVLAADGSVRFVNLATPDDGVTLQPRP
jgi:hypothetical protein